MKIFMKFYEFIRIHTNSYEFIIEAKLALFKPFRAI